ncbi:non-canonical purine NTP pyrophosphatase [Botrimarina mediterranea]|uniref:dITP/XTP pyrophosphatase n=1 Tax=Botrimarina mediterranea TaxID=2528022 RepID=A0A518K2L5_9BACT|nr:non-canonical purine NTP pyrophosphatase [Botrimarina mediterranea]QDV72032.1 Non-canonical purine NTP pyrophosphatase [Botrimarina mediterranea]QDV76573.1 Non-canonical purine NTP pyrophosphatase [Planctomycetes bacterium K2D]
MKAPTLVIGSRNAKKRDELVGLLAPRGIEVKTLADFPDLTHEVDEDGDSFEHNARKKATEYAKALGHWVLADDSGVCIDALGGAPGVYSAHYAGKHGDDAANNALVLEKLAGLPPEKRGAHYVAMLVLADPEGSVRAETRGECHGRILTEPHGAGGFGYDPLFEVREYHRTFGQMGPAVKRAISHRSRAMRAMLPHVVRLVKPT